MSDRDGIVLYAKSPAGFGRFALAGLGAITVSRMVSSPLLAALAFVGVALLSANLLLQRQKLVFRARTLEIHWLFGLREIPYVAMSGVSIEPERVRLRLRDGGEEVFGVRGMDRMGEAIGLVLRQVTGVPVEGESPTTPVTRSEQLVTMLRTCGDANGFVDAFARSEALLVSAGLDVAALGPSPETYRDARDRAPEPELLDFVRLAEIRKTQTGGGEITPLDVLLAMYLEGAKETHVLIRAGLLPMRLVDQVAHGLSPEESDARAAGKVTFAVDAETVALEVIDDSFTPAVVVVDLLEPLVGAREAERIANEVQANRRAHVASYERSEGIRKANALMKEARSLGSPLLVELTTAKGEAR